MEASFLTELQGHPHIIEMLEMETSPKGTKLVLKYMPGEFLHKIAHRAVSQNFQVLKPPFYSHLFRKCIKINEY